MDRQYAKKLELENWQRLSSMYFLSHKLTHEVNNILMLMDTTVSLMRAEEQTEGMEYVEESLEHSCRRLSDLSGQLSSIEPIESNQYVCSLNELVASLVDDFQQAFDFEIDVDLNQQIELSFKESEIKSILVHLIMNAWEAQSGQKKKNKRISIHSTISNARQLKDIIDVDGYPVDSHPGEKLLRIDIIDNGSGVLYDQLPQLHLPFYTTKPKYSSLNGLGLAVVNSHIKQNGGHLSLVNLEQQDGLQATLIYSAKVFSITG